MNGLKQGRLDAVVFDAPVLLWFVSGDEASLAPVLDPLDREELGLGMRRGTSSYARPSTVRSRGGGRMEHA